MASTGQTTGKAVNGGRFDFDDGGTYCGGWEDGKAHGHGVCTGPKGQGEYSGSWHYGFEVNGVYTWPSGSTYEGQWQNGKRHGLGVETRGRWVYRGEWTQGFKGRYGVRQSTTSAAKYEGTWANGLQDGYGSEMYADSGTYKGQWLRGLRHGYGVRTSAQFGQASITRQKSNPRGSTTSLRSDGAGDPLSDRDRKVDDGRGGFVLRARSDEVQRRRGSLVERSNIKNVFKGMKGIRRQRSTGDIQTGKASGSIRSSGSSTSWMSTDSGQSSYTVGDVPDEGSNASFIIEDEQLDANVVETYMGEWKNDKRSGFGISERTDGLKYEGEWYNNKKYGYGVTSFKDGTKEEGKYKNNVLITSNKRMHLFHIRSAKFRERMEAAVAAAQRASKIAMQKEDIAISRTATARGKAEQADLAAIHAREDSDIARMYAKQFAPDFHQPGLTIMKSQMNTRGVHADIAKIGGQKGKEEILPHAKSLYGKGEIDDFIGSKLSNQDSEIISPSLGRGPGYDQGLSGPMKNPQQSSDIGDVGYRKTSMNPSLGHEAENIVSHSDHYMPEEQNKSYVKGGGRHSGTKSYDSGYGGGGFSSAIMNDRFDYYNRPPSRPPSRDRSVDRFGSRGQTPVPAELINPRSRAPSAQMAPAYDWTPDSGVYDDEVLGSRRPSRPASIISSEIQPLMGNGSAGGGFPIPYHIPATQQEAESILRQRVCGQEITPSYPSTPGGGSVKRTESLYINPVVRRQAQIKSAPAPTSLKRKKSLPDVQQLPQSIMPREEASVLSSAQRETVRKNAEDAERYRANPFLYLTSPNVQDWFSRQRLVVLILFLNLSLALMFFKLLS